jgi:hypothetical protein
MRTVLCLFLLVSLRVCAQKKTEQNENFVHLEFSFEKGKFELTDDHLYTLGVNNWNLFKSPVVMVMAYYPPGGNQARNESLAMQRLEEIRRFLEEESVPADIVIMEAVAQNNNADLVLSYLQPDALIGKPANPDTLIVHPDGYHIRCKLSRLDDFNAMRIRTVNAREAGLAGITDKGEKLAAHQILELTFAQGSGEGPDSAYIYVPADERLQGASLSAYRLNPYTKEWQKITAGARQVTLAKKKFFLIPFVGKGYVSLQYSLENQAVPVILKAPAGMGFLHGTAKTEFPDMAQPGDISADQKKMEFLFNPHAEGISLQLKLMHVSGETRDADGTLTAAEIHKKLKNLEPGEFIEITLKKEHFASSAQAGK